MQAHAHKFIIRHKSELFVTFSHNESAVSDRYYFNLLVVIVYLMTFLSQQLLAFKFLLLKASKICYLEQEVIWPLNHPVILLYLLIMFGIFYYAWFNCLQYIFFDYGNILLVN